MGAAQNVVLGAEQAAVDDGATAEQVDAARHEAYPPDAFERGSVLAPFPRWQVLLLGLMLRQVNQADSGPLWLAAAHAADGLQLLLNICAVTTPDDRQGAMLPDDIAGTMDALGHARANIEMLEEYAAAGGRDYDTYPRMLDHLAREGMHFTQGARSALTPDVWKQAAAQVAEAAGAQPLTAGMLDALHQRLAISVLATVWFAGQHHLVDPGDWPHELPAVVLDAVRRAPAINEDPNIANPYRHP